MKTTFKLILLISFSIVLCSAFSVSASPEYTYFIITSFSMRPTFEVGDVITVLTGVSASQVYAAPYPNGDIIVLRRPTNPEEIIVRRVIQKSYVNGTYYFQTKGDANSNPDLWIVSEGNIIGKVIAYSRTYVAGTWNEITYNVTINTNSTVSDFVFNQTSKLIMFNIEGYISLADGGFCNVTIPKTLLRCNSLNEWQVRINETNVDYTATENGTHTFIYFTYSYSTQSIQIIGTEVIPEFPTAIILPLTSALTTLSLIMRRKIKQRYYTHR